MAIIDRPSSTNMMEMSPESDVVALEETRNVEEENLKYGALIGHIKHQFERAKDRRRADETRWELSYRNYRGQYAPDMRWTETEKSRVFIKVTKTKVLAAYAKITEVLFAQSRFPVLVSPTPRAKGVEDAVHIDTNTQNQEQKLPSTVSRPELASIGPLMKRLEGFKDKLMSGVGLSPTTVTYEPAKEAAALMDKQIQDQLEETDAAKHLRFALFECALFGTGIMKGPFAYEKEYPKWTKDGNYEPEFETVPKCSHVSIWDFYPDPDARSMAEAEKVIERHRLSRTELRALKKRPYFRHESIDLAIDYGTQYTPEYWEHTLEDFSATDEIDRFEVLEYWGVVDKKFAEEYDIDTSKLLKNDDQVQCNIWICNNQVLRFVLNPFKPARIPYVVAPYEINPYSFFGIGVAENMEDTQELMNGFMRLAVDNAALSGNIILEVDETMLVPGQDMNIYPGKIFRRQTGAPGQAIYGTKLPNISNEILQMYDKIRQQADEATGIPSYSHGQTGVTGVGRTASGISMLMGAAAENIKSVVRNIDDYMLAPLGKAFFNFNMQFNFKEEYTQGDLDVVALGTESLVRNEIRSQKLMQFSQTMGANPQVAPLIKWDYIARETAKTLDLEPDLLVNDTREAVIQAMKLQEIQRAQGGPQPGQSPQPSGGAPSVPGPGGPPPVSDPTGQGGGNIAPGAAPPPGAQGFSGPQG